MLALLILRSTLVTLILTRMYYYEHIFVPNRKTYDKFIEDIFSSFNLMLESEINDEIPTELKKIQDLLIANYTIIENYTSSLLWIKRLDISSILFSILTFINFCLIVTY